ncbi:MAG: hypothetical protein VKO39_01635 [Cyanobacteriota bacterium]|nr:hypothetical protein [Cyanobacteriota bacterium]
MIDFHSFLDTNGNACQISDKNFTNFNTAAWSTYPADTQISLQESGAAGITHSIVLQSASGFNNITPYDFNYSITAVGTQTLDWWRPASSSSLGNPGFTIDWTLTNPTTTVSRTAGSGLSPMTNFTVGAITTDVLTKITTQSGSDGPQAIQLTVFQTPGPLPLLGAGLALGFSRKIRNRIKVAV